MNIFAVHNNPVTSARMLPDRHVTKMVLESAQMLSVVFSHHYWDIGPVMKVDGTPFLTKRGAFKNHPCTQWAAKQTKNCAWLIMHGLGLCDEFGERFGSEHGLMNSLFQTKDLFEQQTGQPITIFNDVTEFARAMPDDLKYDESIDDITAYRQYLNTKEWCYYNYLRLPDRRPDWLIPTSK